MNTTALRKHEPVINLQALETPASGMTRNTSTNILKTIIIIFAVTALAVYATFLKFQIEEKYTRLEKMNAENRELDETISTLEAEVESMMRYERIDNLLKANNIDVYPPERAFHIKLTGDYEPVANADKRWSNPRGKI